MRVIGLMSGTSLDGVDAAAIETDGETVQAFGPRTTLPYEPELRADLRRLIDRADALAADDPLLRETERQLTEAHGQAVRALEWPAEMIGFHGQTILHRPAERRTWQIGDAPRLARETGLPVAFDFRSADVAAGGQGAPFVPAFHAALAAGLSQPLLVLNIGGVANLTWIGENELLACDTGPGCALLDDWAQHHTGEPIDRDGRLALAGHADETILQRLLAHPFFALPSPKSLDRQDFAGALDAVAGLSPEDGAATLAAFTARAVAATPLPGTPERVLVTGGGRCNPAIMAALEAAFGNIVAPVEAVGWDGDALEAQCFGYLAVRVSAGWPLSFPGTTGVTTAMPGGRIAHP